MPSKVRQFIFASLFAATSSSAMSESFVFAIQETSTGPQAADFFWEEMSVQQRAQLWPLLNHEQRIQQWRVMNKDERTALRRQLSPIDIAEFKSRFTVDAQLLEIGEMANRILRHMTQEEKTLLRNQIRQFQNTLANGIPFNCTDPTDCPKHVIRLSTQQQNHD